MPLTALMMQRYSRIKRISPHLCVESFCKKKADEVKVCRPLFNKKNSSFYLIIRFLKAFATASDFE